MSSPVESLAKKLVHKVSTVDRRVTALENKNDLGFSSIEDNRALPVYATDGTPTGSFGGQYDGTTAAVSLSGPTPPTTTTPRVTGGLQAVIHWDGFFEPDNTVVAPMDFSRVEIHASKDSSFSAETADTLRDTFESPRGGEKTIALPFGQWFIKLVTRSLSGKRASASKWAEVVTTAPIFEEDLTELNNRLAGAEATLETTTTDLDSALGLLGQVPTDIETAKQAAITAAAVDAATKADAAKQAAITAAAADATTKADAAKALANTAQAAADQAKADALAASGLAGSKGEVIVQTSAPTGTRAVVQNLWIRLPDNKPHRWNPDSAATSKWEAVTDKAATDAAAAAGAAQTKANEAATAAATAQSRADSAYTLAGTANTTANSALTSANGKTKVYRSLSAPSGSGGTAGDIWWQYADSTYRVVTGEWTWDGDSWETQKVGHQTISSVDLGSLTVVGTATMNTAVVNEIFAKAVKAKTVEATEGFIGSNAVITGSLTAANIDTEDFFADTAVIDKLTGRMATYLTNQDGSGRRSTVSGQGLKVEQVTVNEFGEIVEIQDIVKLGTFDQDALSISKGSEIVSTIDADGNGSFQSISADNDFFYRGQELLTFLDSRPEGIHASLHVTPGVVSNITNTWLRVCSLSFVAQPGRNYRLSFQGMHVYSSGAGDRCAIKLSYAPGAAPTASTGPTDMQIFTIPGANQVQTSSPLSATGTFNKGTEPVDIIATVWIRRETGSGSLSYNGYNGSADFQKPLRLWVEDVGIDVPESGVFHAEQGTAPPATPTAPAKTTRTSEWGFSGVRSYTGSNAHYNYNVSKGYQGPQPYTGNGNLKSIWTFPSVTSTLSGATIHDIWVYLYFEHWYYSGGGTARIMYHGHSALPGSFSASGLAVTVGSWPKAAGKWVRLAPSLYAGFQSGAIKGIGLEGDNTYQTYGIANNARLRIRYTK